MRVRFSHVAREERSEILGSACVLGLMMAAHALLETARDALFLRSLSANYLPWVYLLIAVLAFGLSWYERRASERIGRREVFSGLLLVAGALTCWLYFLAERPGTRLLFGLYVWSAVYATLMTVQFWLALSARHTITEAKRLFGIVGAGGITGAIAGSVAARIIAGQSDTRHMLLLAGGCMMLAAPLASWVLARRAPLLRPPREEAERSFSDDVRAVRSSRYLLRLSLLVVVATVASTLASFVFKREVATSVAPTELGVFFATTYLVVNILSLCVQLFAVGWLLDRFGAHRALCALPALLLFGAGAYAVGGGLMAALLLQGADGTLKHSVYRTSVEVLYVPVPHKLRPAGKAVADVLGHRGGQAIASAAILLLLLLPTEFRPLSIALIGLCAAWIITALTLRTSYLELFRKTLTDHTMTESTAPLDKPSLEAIFAALNSPRDERVLAALELLAAHDKTHLIPALILHHPSPQVVLRCLDMFASSGDDSFLPVGMRLLSHENSDIRAAALRAVTAVGGKSEALREAADDDTPEVRATAIVNLIASRRMPLDQGRLQLQALIDSGAHSVRSATARALTACPTPVLAPILERLARDENVEVRADAIAAIEKVADARFLDVLLLAIGERRLRESARCALLAIGQPALDALTAALKNDRLPLRTRLHIPRSLSRFKADEASGILLARLEHERSGSVQYKILRALGHLQQHEPQLELDQATIRRITQATLQEGRALQGWVIAMKVGTTENPELRTPAGGLLAELVDDILGQLIERVFRLFSLGNTREDYRMIHRCVRSTNATIQAGALELLIGSLPESNRDAVLGLLTAEPVESRLERLNFEQAPAYEMALAEMIESPFDTVSAFAAYHAAELRLTQLDTSFKRTAAASDVDWTAALTAAQSLLARREADW